MRDERGSIEGGETNDDCGYRHTAVVVAPSSFSQLSISLSESLSSLIEVLKPVRANQS